MERVKLNVEGEIFEVYKDTLVQQSEYFRILFNGKFQQKDVYFINRDKELFRHILRFLRTPSYFKRLPIECIEELDYFRIQYNISIEKEEEEADDNTLYTPSGSNMMARLLTLATGCDRTIGWDTVKLCNEIIPRFCDAISEIIVSFDEYTMDDIIILRSTNLFILEEWPLRLLTQIRKNTFHIICSELLIICKCNWHSLMITTTSGATFKDTCVKTIFWDAPFHADICQNQIVTMEYTSWHLLEPHETLKNVQVFWFCCVTKTIERKSLKINIVKLIFNNYPFINCDASLYYKKNQNMYKIDLFELCGRIISNRIDIELKLEVENPDKLEYDEIIYVDKCRSYNYD